MHATVWLGIEQCFNLHLNLVPEESGRRFAQHTYQKYVSEKWSGFMASVSGACVMGLIPVTVLYSHFTNLSSITQYRLQYLKW